VFFYRLSLRTLWTKAVISERGGEIRWRRRDSGLQEKETKEEDQVWKRKMKTDENEKNPVEEEKKREETKKTADRTKCNRVR
jgi:hypothetical protein